MSPTHINNLPYSDFKALLKAGRISNVGLSETVISGTLINEGLESILAGEVADKLRKLGRGEHRFTTVRVEDPALAGAQLILNPSASWFTVGKHHRRGIFVRHAVTQEHPACRQNQHRGTDPDQQFRADRTGRGTSAEIRLLVRLRIELRLRCGRFTLFFLDFLQAILKAGLFVFHGACRNPSLQISPQ